MQRVELFDDSVFKPDRIYFNEQLAQFHKAFESKVKPENNTFGSKRIDMGNGVEKIPGKTVDGHACNEYYKNGVLYLYREALGNHRTLRVDYDDLGQAYLKTFTEAGKNIRWELSPDTTIKKGNFTAQTDSYGRVVSTKMTDITLKEGGYHPVTRFRDKFYLDGDEVAHGIPDQFMGPASKENTFAQCMEVNRGAGSKIREAENMAAQLKREGHTVDYEVKANYSGTKNGRPTSFETRITVDGTEEIVQKVYNTPKETVFNKTILNVKERFGTANEVGMKSGLIAAGLTCAVSTVDNISQCVNGEISGEEAAVSILKDTAVAGGVGYGSAFITVAVSEGMKGSSQVLIQRIGGSCLPAAVTSFAVTSCTSVMDYASGEINAAELTYELGDNAAMVVGGLEGAKIGAAVGTAIAPGVGTVAGGIVGGMVGTVVASAAYTTAIELGAEGAEYLGEKVEQLAQDTVELFEENIPDMVGSAKVAFNDFFNSCNLPFAV